MIKYNHQKLEMLSNIGTLYYKAPEIFNFGFYNQEVDIWAVGVICYEMIMGDFPFRSKY
jgi:serine/threonine protein kinase